MAEQTRGKPGPLERITSNVDAMLAVAIVGVMVLMIIPLPTQLMSVLLVLNISVSVVVLLMSMYITSALQFSSFPSVLLSLTIFRLALNVASTKLILLQADAGDVVRAFGEVVVRGNIVVGFVIFIILVIVQFIVITKGAERVSEVAARFTLDAMPGKQMGVDADLNAGIIGEAEARARREQIRQEADFYGAMDGASKFVRGDAVASIIVLVINILGGILIGLVQGKMDWLTVLKTYTILTIGDGLVHQIPALFISTATGLVVTRTVSSGGNLGQEIAGQVLAYPKALLISMGTLFAFGLFGFVSGLPSVPFLVVGAIIGAIVYLSGMQRKTAEAAAAAASETARKEAPRGPEDVSQLLTMDILELEIGYSLIPLVDTTQNGDLLYRITMVRKQTTQDLGIIVPPVRIRDNITLPFKTYVIKIRGIEIARGEVMVNQLLAMSPGETTARIPGTPTVEPAFGLPALWITEEYKTEAEMNGFTVIDPSSVISTHLSEVIKSHAHELLGRQETQQLINNLKEKGNSAVIDELIPSLMNIGAVQKVLQNLLRERVSIRNLVTILETLADYAPHTKDHEVLTEYVRHALSRQISRQFLDRDGKIPAVTLDPRLEKFISESVQHTERGSYISMDPAVAKSIIGALSEKIEKAVALGHQPLVMCSAGIRLYFKKFIEQFIPTLPVVSYSEVNSDVRVTPIGMVGYDAVAGGSTQ